MAVPTAYTIAFSFTALLCTALSFALAYKRDHRNLCVGYAISACFNVALVVSSMLAIWSDRAVLNRANSAFLCLSIAANPLIQSEHLNKTLSIGSQPRSLRNFHWGSFLKGFHLRSSLKNFNLRSFLKKQYVLVYIWFSRVAAIGKVAAAAMLAAPFHAKDVLRIILLFAVALDYFIPALIFFRLTIHKLKYKALLKHFGCYVLAMCGFLASAIITSCYEGSLLTYAQASLLITSATQCWLFALHRSRKRRSSFHSDSLVGISRDVQLLPIKESGKHTNITSRSTVSSHTQTTGMDLGSNLPHTPDDEDATAYYPSASTITYALQTKLSSYKEEDAGGSAVPSSRITISVMLIVVGHLNKYRYSHRM